MADRVDVATFGEALVVLHPHTPGPLAAVRGFEKGVGGAELNVAIGLARLGHHVAWAGRVGADPFGHEILATLRGERVDVVAATIDLDAGTGLYVKELGGLGGVSAHYFRTDTAASRTRPVDLDLDILCAARVLHLTGITAALSHSCHAAALHALEAARARRGLVAFDANLRPALLGDRDPRAVLAPFLEGSDLLFLSANESHTLFGTADPAQLQNTLAHLHAHEIVVHDQAGAHAITSEAISAIAARTVTVVDPVGAGDAFVAGYLSGHLRGWEPAHRLRLAELCAANVVTVAGDHAGAPTDTDARAALGPPAS